MPHHISDSPVANVLASSHQPPLPGLRGAALWCAVMFLQCVFAVQCFAQDFDSSAVSGERPQRTQLLKRYVIHRLSFVIMPDSAEPGEVPTQKELESVPSSRQSDFSITSRILRSFAFEAIRASREVPASIRTTLVKLSTTSAENEIRYFDRATAGYDVLRLQDYFTQRGYHDATARYHFHISADERDNHLAFLIYPGRQYSLDTAIFVGLDSLPPDVKAQLAAVPPLAIKQPFGEGTVTAYNSRIISALHDAGYAFAGYQKTADSTAADTSKKRMIDRMPTVSSDTVRKRDSVTVFFNPGRRYRIGSITFADSTRGYPVVVSELKSRQLEFATGDWYKQSSIDRSYANLNNLGTFDRIAIALDTAGTSDTLNARITTLYKRVWEFTAIAFFNATFPDNFNNFGADFGYLNRNFGGAAQALNLYFRPTLRNTSFFWETLVDSSLERAWQLSDKDYEFGALFSQPDFFRAFGNKRVDLSSNLLASYRFVVNPLKLYTANFRVSLTMPLRSFLERVQLDLINEWQQPERYSEALDNAIAIALREAPGVDTALTTQRVTETLDQYDRLNSYSAGRFLPTSLVATLSYTNDQRNDLFYPSSGYTFNASVDLAVPILAGFTRVQAVWTTYTALSEQTVGAFKARGGTILWYNPDTYIVPFERHYFMGGASSIRSYPSRTLRDPVSGGNQAEIGT
ncbi:MAG: BamA/TamA family outer membrane protein, partial [Candidatus Kapabacteria bacterium]|nr:BamA/TamA family outer membrane protein [Candidatus Kapabacteria bacterium]